MKSAFLKILKNRDLLAICGLLLLSLGFFARLFYPEPKIFATAEIGINDVWYLNFPLKNFLSEQLKAGKLPVWDPYRNGGFPDLAEGQIGTFNLYNLIAFRFLPAIHAFNLGFVVIFSQCALGLYLFARRKHLSPLVAFYAAVVYAFSGFFVTHISHFVLLQTASYFPLLMYAADLLLLSPSLWSMILFSVFLSQQLFSGFPQLAFISGLGIVLYAAYLFFTKQTKLKGVVVLTLAFFLGFILSGAQLLPTLEMVPFSSRSSGVGTNDALYYRFPVEHLLSFINPYAFGNPQAGTYPHFNDFKGSLFWENTGYVGLMPLVLFGIALFSRRLRDRFFYLTILGFAFLLMLGGGGPLYFLLTFPPFSYFRFPSRFLLLFVFALVIVSAFGLQALGERFKKKRIISWILVTISILSLWFFWYSYHPTIPFKEYEKSPQIVNFIKKEPQGKIFTYLANAHAFAEFFASGSTFPDRYLDLREELAPNINLVYHLPTSDAYASSLTPKRQFYYNSLLTFPYKISTSSAVLDLRTERLLAIRNTTHIISPIELLNPTFTLIHTEPLDHFPEKPNVYLYRNTSTAPKYYAVNSYTIAETLEEFLTQLTAKTFDPKTRVILESGITEVTETKSLQSDIAVLNETASSLSLEVKLNQPAILVVTNSYDRGWRGFIDDQPTEVFPVNLINQGVTVPNGNHKVTFSFAPKSINVGIIISLLGYALLMVCAVVILARKIIKLKRRIKTKKYARLVK